MLRYHAFISYSHAADSLRATALQRSLEKLARPWYQVRSGLRIFRDGTDLAVAPHLEGEIQAALAQSEWLLLLACPNSAASKWVTKEVQWWLANRSVDRLLLVKTGGALAWDDAAADFVWPASTALNGVLIGRFVGEPLHADLSQVDIKGGVDLRNSSLRADVIRIAARLLGRSPAEIESEDLQQLRRNKAWAICAVALIAGAAAFAGWQWQVAARRADDLRTQGLRSRSNELYGNAESAHANGADELAIVLSHYALATDPENRAAALRAVAALSRSPAVATLRGHVGAVDAVAFSTDGQRLVTAGTDGTAVVWDAARGQQTAVLRGHEGAVKSAVFSPDGQLVLTAGADKSVRTWISSTGQALQVLKGHDGIVEQAEFSSSGTQAVSAGNDNTARVWTLGGVLPPVVLEAENPVSMARFSPDGSQVLTISADRTPRLWRAQGSPPLVLHGLSGRVWTGGFTADGRHVFSVGDDGIALWNSATGARQPQFNSARGMMLDGALDPAGSRLATLGADNKVKIWDLVSGKPGATFGGPNQARLLTLTFSRSGRYLASLTKDDAAVVWDAGSGRALAQLRGHTDALTALAFDADDERVATASADGTARLWRVHNSPLLQVYRVAGGKISSARFSPDGNRVMAVGPGETWRGWRVDRPAKPELVRLPPTLGELQPASPDGQRLVWINDGTAHLVAVDDGRLIAKLSNVPPGPQPVTFSPDGQRLAVRNEGVVRIWSAATGSPLATLNTGGLSIQAIAFDRSGKRAVTCDIGTESAKLWDVAQARLLAELKGVDGPCRAVFSPDGSELMTIGEDGKTRWWSAPKGQLRLKLQGHHGAVTQGAYSVAGDRVLTVGVDRTVRVWDVRTGRAVAVLNGHEDNIRGAEFSLDGRLVLTVSKDGSARVWDSAFGVELIALRADGSEMVEAHFNSAGRQVLTLNDDGIVRLWDISLATLPTNDLLAALQERIAAVGIGLTQEQCQLYFLSSIGQRPPECLRPSPP